MSASLVGSEMCIRDRDEGSLPLRGRRPLVERQALVARARLVGPRVQVSDCLLYTSDAADDMQ
eukprot:1593616-Alexandrium_andersonii.AAC.1